MEDDDAPSIVEDMTGSAVFLVTFEASSANGIVEVRAFNADDARARFLATYSEAERASVTISASEPV